MKKSLKKQLLEIVDSLHFMHQEIEDRLENGEYQKAINELCDCQDAAIQTGRLIEQIEGEGTAAVSCLEQYCEYLYSVSMQLEALSPHRVYKKLEEVLTKTEDEIQHISIKKVAVFLPYKASMWDSLESVWRASREDEEWECIVMPIPYFNKNPDGTIASMVYEGNDFPVDVPITDWRRYSLKDEHPDMIFIHNPYDKYNYVTSIHPDFYCSKIKDYTDKLVYIPYYVHLNDFVDESYCVLPGTLYADTVILQSEKVKEQYIQYYINALPNQVVQMRGNTICNKFLALGSPKFDCKKGAIENVPDDWKKFLLKDKKVVFFNTHLSSLMKGKSSQFFNKLEWVFDFFTKRDDVVLLWRPHPLMVDTAKSMNPNAVEPYLKLVERYRKEEIGIYDDSKDLRRAINLSDIYYGDNSSVAEIFSKQEKPVMLMNHDFIG